MHWSRIALGTVLATAAGAAGTFAWYRAAAGETDPTLWNGHRDQVRTLPDEWYHRDRFREVRGHVVDEAGVPVPGASVTMSTITDLDALLADGSLSARAILEGALPVEATTTTDAAGFYQFDLPSEGLKTLCFNADGFAPARRDNLVVRDGVSNWFLDVQLKRARAVDIDVSTRGDVADGAEVVLLNGWWPSNPRGRVRDGLLSLTGVGGDLERGELWLRDGDAVRELGSWSADAAGPPSSDDAPSVISPSEVAAAPAGLSYPSDPTTALRDRLDPAPASPAAPTHPNAPTGNLRGYVEAAFLPVRAVDVERGLVYDAFANRAAEYWFEELAIGAYRIEAGARLGRTVFPKLAVVSPGEQAEVNFTIYDRIEPDDPRSRVLHGVVRYDSGEAAKQVAVFCQDTTSFRRYLRQIKTDDNGYYRCDAVEPGRYYVLFALPEDPDVIKNFHYPQAEPDQRATQVDLVIHRLMIQGRAAPAQSVALQRRDEDSDSWRSVWTRVTDEQGAFRMTYVDPGVYRVIVADRDGDNPHVVLGPTAPIPMTAPPTHNPLEGTR